MKLRNPGLVYGLDTCDLSISGELNATSYIIMSSALYNMQVVAFNPVIYS